MDGMKYPIPDALRMARLMGEYHLLTSGGVLEQPVIIQVVNYARYLDDLWNRMKANEFQPQSDNEDGVVKQINAIRTEILTHG